MIVADTNVLAYLWIPGPFTPFAECCLEIDDDWVAPPIWRSELRNVLALYLRKKMMDMPTARLIMKNAEKLMQGKDAHVPSEDILDLTLKSSCSAYDCEFITLAQRLNIKLVTKDTKLIKVFPHVAIDLEHFVRP